MEYTYATLLLNEANREINERNMTDVLEAAGVDVSESRAKAFVAAMEGVDLDETVDTPDASTVASEQSDEPVLDEREASAAEEPADATDEEPVATAGATTDDEAVAPLETDPDEPEGS